MSTGQVPLAWKQATVTPVFKGGIASDPSNYRPISLTSVFSKLMERVVVLDMLRYCRQQGLISKQQHGFLARKSTVTNMLSCMNDWTCALMNRSSVAVAYIDFQKAFDSVCHTKLFCKLESMGFVGNLLQWLVSFLTDRWQCTRVGNCMSEPARIISGVIQGSCIGPLLFLLYVNSLINIFDDDVTCHLFADDVKLYTVIKSPSDWASLQNGLDKVFDWSVVHQLPISVRKCCCIVLGSVDTSNAVYNIGKQPIDCVSKVRDLGIIVDSSLKFTSHIDSIVAKANGRAALIHKCFVSRNPGVMVRAFKVYVRPMLEYAVSVWSPCYNYAVDRVESVQRKFTRRLRGCKNMDYSARLDHLQLQSLERRRLVADLVLTYRIIFGLVDLNMSDYFSLQSSNGYSATTRGNPYKLFVNHCRINVRKHF